MKLPADVKKNNIALWIFSFVFLWIWLLKIHVLAACVFTYMLTLKTTELKQNYISLQG